MTLRPGRDKPVRAGHPWVFSGAVGKIEPREPEAGQPCRVYSHEGEMIAAGYVNPSSRITCRLAAFDKNLTWDESLISARLDQALALRERLLPPQTDCLRLVNSEGDFLPGIVVDRYGPGLVLELTTAGADRLRDSIVRLLREKTRPEFIYENSSSPPRVEEGLSEARGILLGELPENLTVLEHGHRFRVDPAGGQKTGFYLDQRENRVLAARCTADGARVINLFCYSGAFSVYCASAGASRVVGVDSSRPALELAAENLVLNGLDPATHPTVRADAFQYLRENPGPFDLAVVDPPPLARRSTHVQKACRAYKDINRLALTALSPGGVLLTFSCSGHVDSRLFRQILFAAALESGREARIIAAPGPGPDHPVSIRHPEGEYLKGLLIQVV